MQLIMYVGPSAEVVVPLDVSINSINNRMTISIDVSNLNLNNVYFCYIIMDSYELNVYSLGVFFFKNGVFA